MIKSLQEFVRYRIARICFWFARRLIRISKKCFYTSVAKSYCQDAIENIEMAWLLTPGNKL